MEMKKLRARMLIVWSALFTIFWVGLMVAVPTSARKDDSEGKWVYLVYFLFCVVPIVIVIVSVYKDYQRHCISYGNGKIIIKRERKRVENGRPVGKWEVCEDEISLRDIKWYGMLLVGESAEYLRDSNSSIKQQFCICLNSGEHFAFMTMHYTKGQIQGLCRYIEEHTGMVQTIRRVKYSTKDKILVIVFVLILYSLLGLGFYYDYISK